MKSKADHDFAEAMAMFYGLCGGLILAGYVAHIWMGWF